MISVVITTHNRAELCKRAIESVKKQTFKDFEIIVVDDCSTEDYTEVASIEGIRYFRQEVNGGTQAKPKNRGIQEAKGEYVCFLDDDNTYREDHLIMLYNEIKKGEFDVVYGDRMIVDLKTDEYKGVGIASDFRTDLIMQRNFIDTSDFIVKKSILEAIGGWDERYKRMLDWNLIVRLFKYGCTFKRIPIVLTNYYVNEDSLSFKDPVIGWNTYDLDIELPFLGHTPIEPKVAIYTLTYDRLDYTKECFETLYETAGYNFDHYIWDNGSTDGTVEYLKSLKPHGYCQKVVTVLSEDNKGISIASNGIVEKIKESEYQVIMKSDNDAYYKTPNWLAKMVEIWKSNRLIALSCYIEGLRDHPGGAERLMYGELKGEKIGVSRHLGGICHFVDASAYDTFKWDETSSLHGVQDLEMSTYLFKNGYAMGYLENYFCEHKDGTARQEKKYKDYFERRKIEKTKVYERSYEDIQDRDSAYSRNTIWGERVKDTVEKYKEYIVGSVLDIGCNDGVGMETIKGLGHKVTGIDISKRKVDVAVQNGLNAVHGYMEELPFKDNEFDTVFCSHVLEHSKDITKAVSEINRVCKRALILVPIEESNHNPAHITIFESGEDLKKLFPTWKVLHEEHLERYEREYVLVIEKQ
jgi:glycosyltransferase involved in cell wall biosynthesis